MKLDRGMLKLSLWPATNKGGYWNPTDAIAIVDRLCKVEGVEEVGASGAGPWHIIIEFDSIEDMQRDLPEIERQILEILDDKSLRHRKITRYLTP